MIHTLWQVALGGALGASARYLTGVATMRLIGPGFPWGTLAVNIVGSFLMGVLVVVLAHKDATRLAPLLMTGVLGGFTTFSAFSLDTITLIERGQTMQAGFYIAASVILSLGAIVLAMLMTRGVFQ
ncbi:CrcB protein [Lutimaribacter pacificus]|uniref:Fluoride-specific ion channel FluC n=1 Tax=Lutimaribacter pacificus TaxID=391948 RepID=A0A1H0KVG1_9RHOB|nr:fluoride efflux transporter CrcB [Lutimaribacter pacificus]SDO59928.1 CrcB protein [Lutimaribacter pacificus]SHK73559.1 camphor resistance protein CrcB [Lutimaribacter pacificus]